MATNWRDGKITWQLWAISQCNMLNGTGYYCMQCCASVYIAYCSKPYQQPWGTTAKQSAWCRWRLAHHPSPMIALGLEAFGLVLFCSVTAIFILRFSLTHSDRPQRFQGLFFPPHFEMENTKTRPHPLSKLEHQNRGGGTQQYRELLIFVLSPPRNFDCDVSTNQNIYQ